MCLFPIWECANCKTTNQYFMKDKLIGEVEQTQIDAWKKSHDLGIFAVKKDGRIGYFKNADFKEMDAYHAVGAKTVGITDEWKTLVGLLWLGGCEELKTSPRYLPDVAKRVQQAMNNGESELVNL